VAINSYFSFVLNGAEKFTVSL